MDGRIQAIYVSGGAPATAQRLLQLGVLPERIAGDSCARTTWDNASFTITWIRDHHTAAKGAQRGWLLIPSEQAVEIWSAVAPAPQRIAPAQRLDGAPLFPGLQIDLAEVWAG